MGAMTEPRSLVLLDGSAVRGGSVALLLGAVGRGAARAGGRVTTIRCYELNARPCEACGPEPTTGFCIFHDDMDRVYEALRDAHAIVVGTPVYFDTVSAPLKLVMDRCNCITPLMRDGSFKPLWPRTRRAALVVACGERQRWEYAERPVRGFLKWVGAKWEETLAWVHADNERGSVVTQPELIARAEALGERLIESPPLVPAEPNAPAS